MFTNLKTLLSNHVAPGGACVSASPFSFCRISVVTNVSPDLAKLDQLKSELESVLRALDADDFNAGRDQLRMISQSLEVQDA